MPWNCKPDNAADFSRRQVPVKWTIESSGDVLEPMAHMFDGDSALALTIPIAAVSCFKEWPL